VVVRNAERCESTRRKPGYTLSRNHNQICGLLQSQWRKRSQKAAACNLEANLKIGTMAGLRNFNDDLALSSRFSEPPEALSVRVFPRISLRTLAT
jgi:hypothetical protein